MNGLTARVLRGPCLGLVVAALPLAALAHHSTLPFDGDHPTTIRGTVREFAWRNPHSYIYLDVKNDAGNVEHWTIETEALIFLRRLGWTKDMMKPGDTVTALGARAKNGSFTMRCKVLTTADGRQYACFPNST
jgi:Family of unknown function (DUF6152)